MLHITVILYRVVVLLTRCFQVCLPQKLLLKGFELVMFQLRYCVCIKFFGIKTLVKTLSISARFVIVCSDLVMSYLIVVLGS